MMRFILNILTGLTLVVHVIAEANSNGQQPAIIEMSSAPNVPPQRELILVHSVRSIAYR